MRNSINNTYISTKPAIKIDSGASPIIQNNTITNSGYGINSDSSSVIINYNNINGNSQNIRLSGHATGNLNATYNWWGTTDTQEINQTIYDFKYDFNLGTVNFVPFLTEPNPEAIPDPNAPIPTPKPEQTPTPTPEQTPSTSPTPTPTASLTPTPTPTQEPQQTDFTTIVGVAITGVVLVTGLGLLIYLIKRK